MLSKRRLYAYLIAVLFLFIVGVIIYTSYMPSFFNIGLDLCINAGFTIFTIIFLNYLFDYREDTVWKRVKNQVYKRISKQFFGLFLDLSVFCKRNTVIRHSTAKTEKENEEEFNNQFISELEELYKKTKLTDSGRNFLLKVDSEFMAYISLIKSREQSLSNIELKYSKFLSPELSESLMIVQDKLQSLSMNMRKKASKDFMFTLSDEEYLKKVTNLLQDIFKEIYKVQSKPELGISFPPK